jgi:hypothetical protein
VQEVRYEKIPAQFDAATLDESKEIRFHIPANSDYFTRYPLPLAPTTGISWFFLYFSFSPDHQLVIDAQIIVSFVEINDAGVPLTATVTEELLYPLRHDISLPLNGLNMLFDDCTVAFNHHCKVDSDRYEAPPPP